MSQLKDADYFLDISQEVCPFTFVRTKLLLERMEPGKILEVRLQGHEPRENVPRSALELGHDVLGMYAEDEATPEGCYRLRIRKR